MGSLFFSFLFFLFFTMTRSCRLVWLNFNFFHNSQWITVVFFSIFVFWLFFQLFFNHLFIYLFIFLFCWTRYIQSLSFSAFLNATFDFLYGCIDAIFSADKSFSFFFSLHIQSVFVISGMHRHSFSCSPVHYFKFLPRPFPDIWQGGYFDEISAI